VIVRSVWDNPPKVPPLSFEGVQVWRLELSPGHDSERLHSFYSFLSAGEKQRADGLRIPPVRDEFIAGRGLLRLLLGAAKGVGPHAIQLATEQNGKPCLASSTKGQPARLEFNVSHSDGLILIALSRASAVGVDVEFVSEEFGDADELTGIARESFHADEFGTIARTPPGRGRLLAFYQAWTRREAVAKADGRGIASLLKYEVSSADEFGESRVSLAGSAEHAKSSEDVDYFVQTPNVGTQHLAAVACRKPQQGLALFDARMLRP
jgi:4'-phosphopantetheinyl transferase